MSVLVTDALHHDEVTCTLELTAHPFTIEVDVHAPGSQPPRMRTPYLYCDIRGAVCARLARQRHRPSRPEGPVHRI